MEWNTVCFQQLSAQITEREGIGFGVVDLENDQKLAEKLSKFAWRDK